MDSSINSKVDSSQSFAHAPINDENDQKAAAPTPASNDSMGEILVQRPGSVSTSKCEVSQLQDTIEKRPDDFHNALKSSEPVSTSTLTRTDESVSQEEDPINIGDRDEMNTSQSSTGQTSQSSSVRTMSHDYDKKQDQKKPLTFPEQVS